MRRMNSLEAGKKHEDMKAQYEKIEQEVDEIDAGIEHAKSQRNETTLLKSSWKTRSNAFKRADQQCPYE